MGNPSLPDLPVLFRHLERRVARLERTSATGGFDETPEFVQTLNITNLAVTQQVVQPRGTDYEVYIYFGWDSIPTDPDNLDAPTIEYLTSWSLDGINWTAEQLTTESEAAIGPLAQQLQVTFRVRARTTVGTYGDYSSITVTTTQDNTAPLQTSTPTVAPYLGQLLVAWDGKDVSAQPMDVDLDYTEVHVSTEGATFTPDATTYKGAFLAPGGNFILSGLTYGTEYWVRLVPVDSVGNRGVSSTAASGTPVRVTESDLGDASVTWEKIANLAVDDAKIANLSVGKLTSGVIGALTEIIAGDPDAYHVVLRETGLYIYGEDPEGDQQLLGQFAYSGDSFLSITNTSKVITASINSDGQASFIEVASADDITVEGRPLLGDSLEYNPPNDEYAVGWLDRWPRGIVAYCDLNLGPSYWNVSATNDTDSAIVELSFDVIQGRAYRITFGPAYPNISTGGSGGFRLRYTKPANPGEVAAQPTTSSTVGMRVYQENQGTGDAMSTEITASKIYIGTSVDLGTEVNLTPGVVRLLLCAYAASGDTITFNDHWMNFYVEDLGLAPADTGLDRRSAPPTTDPVKSYTSTWVANNSGTYKGNGDKRTDTTDIVQGYNSYNGDGAGIILFTSANSTGGETNKSITTALTGATVLKVEAYLYSNHWWYNSGGTAWIGYHGSTTVPSTIPSAHYREYSLSGWKKPGGRWITLPSSWHADIKDGDIRGITLGSANSTSGTYYGRFDGHNGSHKPKLRITYKK